MPLFMYWSTVYGRLPLPKPSHSSQALGSGVCSAWLGSNSGAVNDRSVRTTHFSSCLKIQTCGKFLEISPCGSPWSQGRQDGRTQRTHRKWESQCLFMLRAVSDHSCAVALDSRPQAVSISQPPVRNYLIIQTSSCMATASGFPHVPGPNHDNYVQAELIDSKKMVMLMMMEDGWIDR